MNWWFKMTDDAILYYAQLSLTTETQKDIQLKEKFVWCVFLSICHKSWWDIGMKHRMSMERRQTTSCNSERKSWLRERKEMKVTLQCHWHWMGGKSATIHTETDTNLADWQLVKWDPYELRQMLALSLLLSLHSCDLLCDSAELCVSDYHYENGRYWIVTLRLFRMIEAFMKLPTARAPGPRPGRWHVYFAADNWDIAIIWNIGVV